MPRTAREKSESGIYHIMLRGINQQNIFEDEEDNKKFIDILERYKTEISYKIYAYCLMFIELGVLIRDGMGCLTFHTVLSPEQGELFVVR